MDEINYINQYYCDKLQTSCNIIRQKLSPLFKYRAVIKREEL